ncbi:hypothetical protein FRC01_006088, partial [Tulasnella sp. 417]
MPIVRIGRIAGQYAKPRSSPTEKIKGEDGTVKEVPSFRGDNVNGLSPNDREPDPQRLLSAYFYSTTTLNYVRSLLASGFASLNHPRDWSLNHVRSPALRNEFETISNGLADAIDFCRTIGAEPSFVGGAAFERGGAHGVLSDVDLYTSHEGLMLDYEEALTRYLPIPDSVVSAQASRNQAPVSTSAPYNTSAHFLWVGDRTRQLTGAHIEYFRGIRNPIGVKVGPSMKPNELVQLLDVVNPSREDGKITLITRYGADKIDAHLAGHIEAVQSSGHPVIWVCDPMHGNTLTSSTGLKTRHFTTIVSEVTSCLRIHTECGSRLGGISLEFTGELNEEGFSVTECLGGSMELKPFAPSSNDLPTLITSQSMAFLRFGSRKASPNHAEPKPSKTPVSSSKWARLMSKLSGHKDKEVKETTILSNTRSLTNIALNRPNFQETISPHRSPLDSDVTSALPTSTHLSLTVQTLRSGTTNSRMPGPSSPGSRVAPSLSEYNDVILAPPGANVVGAAGLTEYEAPPSSTEESIRARYETRFSKYPARVSSSNRTAPPKVAARFVEGKERSQIREFERASALELLASSAPSGVDEISACLSRGRAAQARRSHLQPTRAPQAPAQQLLAPKKFPTSNVPVSSEKKGRTLNTTENASDLSEAGSSSITAP